MAFGRAGLDVLLHAAVRVPDAFLPLPSAISGIERPLDHRERLLFENVADRSAPRAASSLRLDQQPRILSLARPAVHAHEMPAAVQLLALEREVEMAFLVDRRADRLPDAIGRGPRS